MTQTSAVGISTSSPRYQRNNRKATTFVAGILITSLTSTTGYVPSLLPHQHKNGYTHHAKPRTTSQPAAFGRILPKLSLMADYRKNLSPTLTTCKAKATPVDTDEEEWGALISSFQMYKAAYGDLKVPSRFVVPSMPPWPESGWGLKLGQRVAAIRSTGKYVQNNEERRKVLDDLGFLWRLRAAGRDNKMDGITFEQVLAALSTYRSELQPGGGTLRVPANFIVPDCEPWPENTRGLPLGKKIPTIRSKAYLKANPGATELLAKIGFEFDGKVAANDERYNRVYTALVRYKEINGDLLVPQPFVIPEKSSEWPEETWGLRLGARVNAIRSQGTFVKTNPARKEELNSLGFIWEKPVGGTEKKRGRKKKVVNEALMGPAPPGILSSEEESAVADKAETPGVQPFDENSLLGNLARGPGESPQWTMLGEDASQAEPKLDDVDWKPPKNFEETNKRAQQRAIDVGVIMSIDEQDNVVKGHIDMKHPWFNDDFGGDFVFEDVVEALTIYKSIYGTFEDMDLDEFVVPDPSSAEYAGLSSMESDISTGGLGASPDDLIAREIELMEMEMESGITSTALEPSMEELMLEQQRMEGATTVDQQWPEHLAGMRLGSIVRRIQEGDLEVKHLPERKKQLDDIDFDWGDSKKFLDVPFDKAMCAMFAYYMIRGDLFVYEDFVMPDEDPWPTALAGFELGKAVFRLRAKQNFLEAYYPRKKYMLNMIEFVWFPMDALPLDPDAPPLSWEHEHVKHIGHPLARINAPPYSAVEHVHPVDHPEAQDRYEFDFELVRDYYENELGVTDIGNFLRERGFMQLADEHEAKYGVAAPTSEVADYEEEYEEEYEEDEEYDELEDDEEYDVDDEDVDDDLDDDEDFEEDDADYDDDDDDDDDEEYEEEEVL